MRVRIGVDAFHGHLAVLPCSLFAGGEHSLCALGRNGDAPLYKSNVRFGRFVDINIKGSTQHAGGECAGMNDEGMGGIVVYAEISLARHCHLARLTLERVGIDDFGVGA